MPSLNNGILKPGTLILVSPVFKREKIIERSARCRGAAGQIPYQKFSFTSSSRGILLFPFMLRLPFVTARAA